MQSVIAILTLATCLALYFYMSYVGMHVACPMVHDFFHVAIDDNLSMLFKHIANTIPLLFVFYRLAVCLKNDRIDTLVLYHCALMYSMKGVVQFVTIVPGVESIDACINRTFVDSILKGNCVDMMFSGHTALVYLLSYGDIQVVCVTLEAMLLVLSHQHYTSDVLMAVIVAQWIRYILPQTGVITTRIK